jgi:hypothetical protein
MATRLYLVELRNKKFLVEASSKESAIQKATAPSVKKVTIPTPLETSRLIAEGVTMLTSATAGQPSSVTQEGGAEGQQGEGVGRLGLDGCNDGEPTGGDEGAPGENSEV